MNITIGFLILTHILCALSGCVAVWIALRNSKIEISINNQQDYQNTNKKTLSETTKEKIKKIEIDSSTVVVDDMNNQFTKMFDDIGSNTINKDNIIEAIDRLTQLKKSGGSND